MSRPSVPAFALVPVTSIALAVAALLTALSGRYGYHRDELYFRVAGEHLAWGYTDQPPLTPLLTRLSITLFGDTLMGMRVVATLSAAITVVVVALIAREFSGERHAQILAAAGTALAGFVLATGHMVSTATFDLLAWMVIALLATRLLRTADGRWWIPLGFATGIALENKYLVVLPLAALLIALLITGPRSALKTWYLPVGIAVAALVAAPNLIWQATHDWPQLTVAGGISEDDGTENRIMFVPLQLLQLSPFLVPIWIAGFRRLWRSTALRWSRAIALSYPILCVIVLAAGGKSYYALPLLLVLVAAGAQPAIDWLNRGRQPVRRTVQAAGAVLTALTSAAFTLPVLPVSSVNVVLPINAEQGEQIGWPELAATVTGVWQQLPAGERDRAVVFAGNYGEAGALAKYGDDLPTAYSGHMSYADWPPPSDQHDGPVVLVSQQRSPQYEAHFGTCTEAARVDNGHDVDNEEQGAYVLRCTGPVEPWSMLWPKLRRYY
jgi:4-amino-4-deoxy-L-arabinose transferase-like glycosyltransferase